MESERFAEIMDETPRFDHVFSLGFSVRTDAPCETGDDYPTPTEIRTAIQGRLDNLSDDEIVEAVGVAGDTIDNEGGE